MQEKTLRLVKTANKIELQSNTKTKLPTGNVSNVGSAEIDVSQIDEILPEEAR